MLNSTHQRHKFPGVLHLFSPQNGKRRIVKFGTGLWLLGGRRVGPSGLAGRGGGALQPGSTRDCGPRAPQDGAPEPGEGHVPGWARVLGTEISCPRGSLTQTSARRAHSPSITPRTPQVNWGARACNTYNEVSVALAKFNYGCICFLIFPRWFDLKGGKKHPKLQRNRLHSSFLQKVRNPDHFFQTPAFSRCVRIHRVAAEARYYSE